jgi:hypothetical protein
MRMLNIVAGVLLVLLLVLGGILIYLVAAPEPVGSQEVSQSTFSVIETGTAGDNVYAVFNYRGSGNLTVLGLDSQPTMRITIINDSQAIQATRLPELVSQIKELESYGYNVTVTDEPRIGEGVYVVPTGALPSYVLFNLQGSTSNGTVIYLGSPDLILSSGMKESRWYNSLNSTQRRRVIVYNQTLDDLLDDPNVSLSHDILYSAWMLRNTTTVPLSGNGIRSISMELNGTDHARLIYDMPGLRGIYDTLPLAIIPQTLNAEPSSIYPWERSDLRFDLTKTNGTAYFTVKKDGKVVKREQLRRVTDENVFIEKLAFEEPGEYLLFVDDSTHVIASGILHVKDLKVRLTQHSGITYVFSVLVDGMPLKNSEAYVSIGNSSDKRKFFITDGELTVNAQLLQGANTFNIDISGSTIQIPFDNSQEPIFEFYLKYGSIGLLVILVVYFGARITKRPVYSLRFGDSVGYVRQEITVPLERAMESFSSVRKDMKLQGVPITAQEFSVGLKRYLTNGADITEGNVEEILKRLEKTGYLESHRDYYQLKGEGDVRGNVLRRIIRENLIESGTQFSEKDGKFITKDYEIGFFGDSFSKKGIIIVDDKAEIVRIISSLTEREQARMRIMQSNATIEFVPIDRLSDML